MEGRTGRSRTRSMLEGGDEGEEKHFAWVGGGV